MEGLGEHQKGMLNRLKMQMNFFFGAVLTAASASIHGNRTRALFIIQRKQITCWHKTASRRIRQRAFSRSLFVQSSDNKFIAHNIKGMYLLCLRALQQV